VRVGACGLPDAAEQAQGADMRDRVAAVVFIVLSLTTGLTWSGEGWAQAKIARVGILVTPLMCNSYDLI